MFILRLLYQHALSLIVRIPACSSILRSRIAALIASLKLYRDRESTNCRKMGINCLDELNIGLYV